MTNVRGLIHLSFTQTLCSNNLNEGQERCLESPVFKGKGFNDNISKTDTNPDILHWISSEKMLPKSQKCSGSDICDKNGYSSSF